MIMCGMFVIRLLVDCNHCNEKFETFSDSGPSEF